MECRSRQLSCISCLYFHLHRKSSLSLPCVAHHSRSVPSPQAHPCLQGGILRPLSAQLMGERQKGSSLSLSGRIYRAGQRCSYRLRKKVRGHVEGPFSFSPQGRLRVLSGSASRALQDHVLPCNEGLQPL